MRRATLVLPIATGRLALSGVTPGMRQVRFKSWPQLLFSVSRELEDRRLTFQAWSVRVSDDEKERTFGIEVGTMTDQIVRFCIPASAINVPISDRAPTAARRRAQTRAFQCGATYAELDEHSLSCRRCFELKNVEEVLAE